MENKLGKKVYSFLFIVLVLIAFILGYYTFAYWHNKESVPARQSVPMSNTLALSAMPLEGTRIPFTKEYVGYVTHIHEAQIQPYINGFIEKIMVKGGEYVRQGDLLIVLQQDQYRAELAAAYADILKAEANFKNAEVYFKRIQKAGSKAVSPTELDNAQAQFLAAKASLEQAKANYALARVNYDYTIIRSPIDGVIGDVSLTPGNYVSPSTGPLLSVMQYNPIRVVFSVTDKEYLQEINKRRPFEGDEISLQLAGGQIYPNLGVFRYTDNAVDKSTNSIAIYVDFKNIGKVLVPNAYVTVLVKKFFPDAISVSKDNVILDETGSYVYIIRQGQLQKVEARILASEGARFIISDTFQKGDYLVTERVKDSYKNQKVEPKLSVSNTTSTPPLVGSSQQRENFIQEHPLQNNRKLMVNESHSAQEYE